MRLNLGFSRRIRKPVPGAYTLLLVPHSGHRAKRWRVQIGVLRLVLAAALLCLLALSWFVYDYTRLRVAAEENKTLRAVNEQQARQIETLSLRAAEVEEQLFELNDLDAEVRELLNLPQPEGQTPGRAPVAASRGGLAHPSSVEDINDSLTRTIADLEPTKERLQNLKEQVIQHQTRMAHLPAGWPVGGRITSRFGVRRSPFGSSTEFHEGIDIAAPSGAPVRATGAGTVVFAGWRSGYGRLVIINHGYGYQTAYGHNSKLKVRSGDKVERGDVIAYVGSSGRSTGPHVHYEVIYNGRKMDPQKYLKVSQEIPWLNGI